MTIANLEYKLKTGTLTLFECVTLGTVSGGLIYTVTHMIEKYKKVDQIMLRNLVIGFIFLTVLINWWRGMMWKQRREMYEKEGFSEKEAKEQALADTRARGGSGSGLLATGLVSGRRRR